MSEIKSLIEEIYEVNKQEKTPEKKHLLEKIMFQIMKIACNEGINSSEAKYFVAGAMFFGSFELSKNKEEAENILKKTINDKKEISQEEIIDLATMCLCDNNTEINKEDIVDYIILLNKIIIKKDRNYMIKLLNRIEGVNNSLNCMFESDKFNLQTQSK